MKNLFSILLTLLFVFTTSSCKDDSDEQNTIDKINNYASYNIDGKIVESLKTNSFNNGVLAIAENEDEIVVLFIPIPNNTPVTYTMETDEIISASYKKGDVTYTASNGLLGLGAIGDLEINISTYENGKISGSFEFVGINQNDDTDSMTIKDGVFNNIPDL